MQRSPNFESVSRGFGRIIRTLLGSLKSPQTGLNHDVEMTNERRSLWISADILSWCVSFLLSFLHVSKQNSKDT